MKGDLLRINCKHPAIIDRRLAGDALIKNQWSGEQITSIRWKDPLGIKLLAYGNYPQKTCWGYKCWSEQLIQAKENHHQILNEDNHKIRVYIYRIRGRRPTTPRGDRTNHKSARETKIGFITNHKLLESRKIGFTTTGMRVEDQNSGWRIKGV